MSCVGGDITNSTTESIAQTLMRSGGTATFLFINLASNSITVTNTITFRDNSTTGNMTISITASTTGIFEDTSNSDTISAGDLINISYPSQSSGTFSATVVGFIFSATTNTVTRLAAMGNVTYNNLGVIALDGLSKATTTEANAKCRQQNAGTLKNLAVNVTSSDGAQADTLISRQNGANGNLTLSIPKSTTGWFEDTSNSDTISGGDDFNYKFSSANIIGCRTLTSDYITTDTTGQCLAADTAQATTIATNKTQYFALKGAGKGGNAAETKVQRTARGAFTFQDLTINLLTNTITNTSTFTLRANAAGAGPSVSITASTTGVFSDLINTYVSIDTDLINYQIVTASTGTSLSILHMTSWTTTSVPPTPVPKNSMYSFINLPPFMADWKLQTYANQSPTFGSDMTQTA